MKAQEFRTHTQEELEKQLSDSYREMLNLRFRLATRQLTNNSELRKTRKKIARIKTVIREKELAREE